MSRWAYFALVVVVLATVGFGLDWQPATMSPMADPKFALPSPAPVPRNKSDGANGARSPTYPASPGVAAPPTSQTVGTTVVPLPPVSAPVAPAVAPNCNVRACATAYRSFVPADCTYQPLNGPRRRCEKR